MIEILHVGQMYSNEEIFRSLGGGNAAGIRFQLGKNRQPIRAVLMTSDPGMHVAGENPYYDRLEDCILAYTAKGKLGEQALTGMNARLTEQGGTDYPVHGFSLIANRKNKAVGPKRWRYLGLLQYLRHYPEFQADANGKVRKVWLFELRVHSSHDTVPVQQDAEIAKAIYAEARRIEAAIPEDDEIVREDARPSGHSFQRTEAVRTKLLELEPRRFELFVRDLLLHCGFLDVCVTKYSGDGGVDVNARTGSRNWLFEHTMVQVQAKRWRHSVGRREVAELRGSLQPLARGAILTTSYFSKAAISESAADGKSPITLVDGTRLSQVVLDEGFPLLT